MYELSSIFAVYFEGMFNGIFDNRALILRDGGGMQNYSISSPIWLVLVYFCVERAEQFGVCRMDMSYQKRLLIFRAISMVWFW